MSTGTAAFLVIAFFTIHEFEEIIRIRPWIRRHGADPRFARDTWIAHRASFPSAEAIAAMIGEEIVLFILILAIAVGVRSLPVVIAVATVNSVHLAMHLGLAGRVRAWNPGSVTAAITLAANAALISWAFAHQMDPVVWLFATVVFGAVFEVNVTVLHRAAPAIQRRIR